MNKFIFPEVAVNDIAASSQTFVIAKTGEVK
jgi:hypothetical protein